MRFKLHFVGIALIAVSGLTHHRTAVGDIVTVVHTDLPPCDRLMVPSVLDELSTAPVGPDQLIDSMDQDTNLVACPAFNDATPNVLVSITNLTTRAFPDVWYVADSQTTSITNVDGAVNDGFAFRIDSPISDPGGTNHPLVSESIAFNDVFEPGETWEFIIDGYTNIFGLPASAFASSPGVGAGSFEFPPVSSGSIIAMVPEPSPFLLVGLVGGLGVLVRNMHPKVAAVQQQ